MFYVYHGYTSPDNYDSSEAPTYKLSEFSSKQEVSEFKKKFDEELNNDCGNVEFRIIEGKELSMKPKEVVTEWIID